MIGEDASFEAGNHRVIAFREGLARGVSLPQALQDWMRSSPRRVPSKKKPPSSSTAGMRKPSSEGPSIEAEVNGENIVFPLGPKPVLSWADCNVSVDKNQAKFYRCDLKNEYRFQESK